MARFRYRQLTADEIRHRFVVKEGLDIFHPDYVFIVVSMPYSPEIWNEHCRALREWAFERYGRANRQLVREPERAGYAVSGTSFITHDPNMAFEFKMRWF